MVFGIGIKLNSEGPPFSPQEKKVSACLCGFKKKIKDNGY
jgi:hypothetical protein